MMDVNERWSDGDAYESYVGRWSRLVAATFIPWLSVERKRRWLDVGCGTGALAAGIVGVADPIEVVGVDASPAYVAEATRRAADPRLSFAAADALSLAFDSEFDAAVSGLMLNFVADPSRAVEGMVSAVRPGGVVAVYVWDYRNGMQLMRRFWDAAATLDPAARALDEGTRFGVCDPDVLAEMWTAAGLDGVETTPIEIVTRFRDFNDYWSPFLGGQGSAPTYVASLAPVQRDILRNALRSSLPVHTDGTITLTARAWAVKGRRPRWRR